MKYFALFALAVIAGVAFSAQAQERTVREYWLVAEEIDWDYAPSFPDNAITGKTFSAKERLFLARHKGRVYRKAVYRAYSKYFAKPIPRGPREKHLGILGPVLRASVGERISVHLRNDTGFAISLHPHGVFYLKQYEGAPYNDGSRARQKRDDAIAPGATYTYVWEVPDRAGPGPADPSSIAWPYHSHVNAMADINAGLVGVLIITARGQAGPTGRPKDVDREFVTLFNIFDENASALAASNFSGLKAAKNSPEFHESNLMHAMNGYVWGNNQGYVMRAGERVRWYLLAMGSEADLHTAHWHGATLLESGRRVDVSELLPASAKTLDMRPDSVGSWLYHCHVNDHISGGMMTLFTVLAKE